MALAHVMAAQVVLLDIWVALATVMGAGMEALASATDMGAQIMVSVIVMDALRLVSATVTAVLNNTI